MPGWSDLTSGNEAPGGPVLVGLVRAAIPAGARVLVAGPHDHDVLDVVVSEASLTTVLLRAHDDARATLERYGERVSVVVGDVSSLPQALRVDAVVALDGLARLVSVDVESPTWDQVLRHLQARLEADGVMLLAVDNPLWPGSLGVAEAANGDADWRPLDLRDATVPATQAAVEALGGVALAGAPSVRRPTLLARLGAVPPYLVLAHTPATATRPDPRMAAHLAVRAGRLDEVVAGWVLVRPATDLPDHLTATPTSVLHEGVLLEPAFLEACARRDSAEVHRLLRVLADAVSGDVAAWRAGTFDNVVVSRDRASLLQPAAVAVPSLPRDVVLLGLLHDIAVRLASLGWRHPWPVALGAVELARLMAAIVGVEADLDAVRAAARQQGEADDARGRARPHAAEPTAEVLRLLDANEALRAKNAWFERTIPALNRQVVALQGGTGAEQALRAQLAAVRGSTSFRLGRALTAPGRVARRLRR